MGLQNCITFSSLRPYNYPVVGHFGGLSSFQSQGTFQTVSSLIIVFHPCLVSQLGQGAQQITRIFRSEHRLSVRGEHKLNISFILPSMSAMCLQCEIHFFLLVLPYIRQIREQLMKPSSECRMLFQMF